jgi:hypothetical protein
MEHGVPTSTPDPRQLILSAGDALDCTLYRANTPACAAEERDMGDAKLLLHGVFQPPRDWSATQLANFFDGRDPASFFSAAVACLAKPGSKAFFQPRSGDYLACTDALGAVQMYLVHQEQDTDHCVLIREDEED